VNVLETERLLLRRISVDDAAFMLELLNEPSFVRFIGDRGVQTIDDARDYVLKGPVASYETFGFGLYLTVPKEDGVPIGICGLVKRDSLPDVDVGFAFLPRFWGKGYASESAAAVIAYGRRAFGLPRVAGVVRPDNLGSIRVLETLGLTFERMVRLSEDGPESKLFVSRWESSP